MSWANVDDDVLILLAEKVVGITPFIRFSAVCKSWMGVSAASKYCYPVPWLMLGENEGSELRDFYDPSTGQLYQLSLPRARGMKNLGFAHGWLITSSSGGRMHFLNPLTEALIDLPLTTTKGYESDSGKTPAQRRDAIPIKATASASPMKPSGDCIVALIQVGYRLWFCRPGNAEWTLIQLHDAYEIAYIGGALYVLTITLEVLRVEPGSMRSWNKIADLP